MAVEKQNRSHRQLGVLSSMNDQLTFLGGVAKDPLSRPSRCRPSCSMTVHLTSDVLLTVSGCDRDGTEASCNLFIQSCCFAGFERPSAEIPFSQSLQDCEGRTAG